MGSNGMMTTVTVNRIYLSSSVPIVAAGWIPVIATYVWNWKDRAHAINLCKQIKQIIYISKLSKLIVN